MFKTIYRTLIGRPLKSEDLQGETLPKWKALPIFSSDALSSVGYGPEQIAIILAASSLYAYFGWVVIAIAILLAIVATSYSQVIKVHPGGGGSYAVAQEYLGRTPSLVAGAALLADYVLTVAVSVSSGTDALTSAFPVLLPYTMGINLFVLFGILMIINLKGVQEASTIFVWPTYAFIVSMLVLIATGVYQLATGQTVPAEATQQAAPALSGASIFFLLHAFANGCSSMTGVEAIANGVTVFKTPKDKNAIKTTVYMAILLGVMLLGLSYLILVQQLMPSEDTTLLSLLAESVFGRNYFYYFIQITTMLILYLAANTSYNGLPPLLSIMSRDGYVPRYLRNRGERLSYDNSIILLTVAAAILIYSFNSNVEHLISLYALGVFLSFTLAQSGLVVHRWKVKDAGWKWGIFINGLGTLITFAVIIIIILTKFTHGAWIIVVFIPTMIYIFNKIHSHYENVRKELLLTPENYEKLKDVPLGVNHIIIPLASPTQAVAHALRYAKIIDGGNKNIHAIHIGTSEEYADKVEKLWEQLEPELPITIVYSPFRQMTHPLLRYVRRYQRHIGPNDVITVIIPEFETKKYWHRLLHNQSAIILRLRLLWKNNVIVTTVPLHFKK